MTCFRHYDILLSRMTTANPFSRQNDAVSRTLALLSNEKISLPYRPHLGERKNGQQKHATCLTTLLQDELNCAVARFTTHIKPVLPQIRLLEGLKMGGKTHNIAFQLVLQQCCKTSCMYLLPVLLKP